MVRGQFRRCDAVGKLFHRVDQLESRHEAEDVYFGFLVQFLPRFDLQRPLHADSFHRYIGYVRLRENGVRIYVFRVSHISWFFDLILGLSLCGLSVVILDLGVFHVQDAPHLLGG